MKCPICKAKINELDEVCPNCKTNFDDYEEHYKKHEREEKRTNADCLNDLANLNIILSVVMTIVMWFNSFNSKKIYSNVSPEINWWGVAGGFGILIAGFTLFFLLKTVVDIYSKVEE